MQSQFSGVSGLKGKDFKLNMVVCRYESCAIACFFTASEIITMHMFTRIYETLKQTIVEVACKTKLGHPRELK